MRKRAVACAITVVLALVTSVETAPRVPTEFAGMYGELDTALTSFEQMATAVWGGRVSPVAFSTEPGILNSNRPGDVIDSHYPTLLNVLDGYRALGVDALTITISYPALTLAYYGTAQSYQAHVDFYRQLAADLHARGLKLIVKTQAILPAADPTAASIYAGLSFDDYKRGRLAVATTIAREMQPEFLSVMVEPDIEAAATGQPVGDPAGAAELASYISDGLRAAGVTSRTLVGAGMGTWAPNYLDFTQAFAAIGSLDYIDMHIYPVQRDYPARVLDIVSIAAAAGKRAAISEAWLWKVRDADLPSALPGAAEIAGRDPYSFWQPLDQRFLGALVRLAHGTNLLFVSPSMSNQFFTYLDYSWSRALSTATRMQLSGTLATWRAMADRFSLTGIAYQQYVAWCGGC